MIVSTSFDSVVIFCLLLVYCITIAVILKGKRPQPRRSHCFILTLRRIPFPLCSSVSSVVKSLTKEETEEH